MIRSCNKEYIIQNSVNLSDYLNRDLQNKESELFVFEGNVVKIIRENLCFKRSKIIKWFYENKAYYPIPLIDIFENDGIVFGYSTKLYESDYTLYNFLWSNASLEERKYICYKLLQLDKQLLANRKMFFDWHSFNFLLSDELIFLDFDSTEKLRRDFIICYRRYLMELIISVLIGIDLDYDLEVEYQANILLFRHLVNGSTDNLEQEIYLPYDFIEKEIASYTNMKVDYQRELVLKSGLMSD